mmetsp:Transcript_10098/g.24042  ORF Transcript_10098/g.24042 Transcript_10098/m.24042 type:complete len:386 (-) Transcript_10098:59-1216(-)
MSSESHSAKRGDVVLSKYTSMCGNELATTALAFSPDGDSLVSGSAESGLLVWSTTTRRVTNRLEGHFDWVLTLAFTSCGSYLVSGSKDWTAKVWDAVKWKYIDTLWGHKAPVTQCVFTTNDEVLATVAGDCTIRLWNCRQARKQQLRVFDVMGSAPTVHPNWRMLTELPSSHTNRITCCAVTRDTKWFFTGADDGRIAVWDVSRWEEKRMWTPEENELVLTICAEDTKGHVILSGGTDGRLRVWHVGSWECLHNHAAHNDWLNALAMDPAKRLSYSGGQDYQVIVWSSDSWDRLSTVSCRAEVMCIAIQPDTSMVHAATEDGEIEVWSVQFTSGSRPTTPSTRPPSGIATPATFTPASTRPSSAAMTRTATGRVMGSPTRVPTRG